MYRIYAIEGATVIEGVVISTSDELMYTRVVDAFTLEKRGSADYTVSGDFSEFYDRYGNPFVDANAFEAYLGTLNITDTPTDTGISELDGGSANSVYLIAQVVDGGNA